MPGQKKVYDNFEINFELRNKSKPEFRSIVVNTFLSEKEGYFQNGIKHVTSYKYFVETLSGGRRIYLLRPTYLNKGIDFQVWVERFRGNQDERPSHKDIFSDLKLKKQTNPAQYPALIEAIIRVWNCEEPEDIIRSVPSLNFNVGFSIELILKVLKWLFIEQDITYWNYAGRSMLREAIENI